MLARGLPRVPSGPVVPNIIQQVVICILNSSRSCTTNNFPCGENEQHNRSRIARKSLGRTDRHVGRPLTNVWDAVVRYELADILSFSPSLA